MTCDIPLLYCLIQTLPMRPDVSGSMPTQLEFAQSDVAMPQSTHPLVRRLFSVGGALLLSVTVLVVGAGMAHAQFFEHETEAKQVGDTSPPPPGGSEVGDTPPPPPGGSQAFQPIETLDEFLNLGVGDTDPPNPGGTRGNICPLSPGTFGPVDMTWSDRPVFIWRGRATQVRVEDFESPNDAAIWSMDVAGASTVADGLTYIVPYTGEPLTPGILYEWILLDGSEIEDSYLFEVMGGEERAAVDAQLAAIATDGLSPQALALEQARVFFEADLWSDALNVLYERNLLADTFVDNVCAPASPTAQER